jgi:hypothetical protein
MEIENWVFPRLYNLDVSRFWDGKLHHHSLRDFAIFSSQISTPRPDEDISICNRWYYPLLPCWQHSFHQSQPPIQSQTRIAAPRAHVLACFPSKTEWATLVVTSRLARAIATYMRRITAYVPVLELVDITC